MVGRTDIETSREIQRTTGRTFHLATRLLPEWACHPTYVLYAFFRVADEVVDDPDPRPPEEQRAELERIRAAALGERPTDDPVLGAFHELKERHDIPDREVETFLDAMAMDVDRARYDTYDDLESYLRGSAVAVAYMMLEVMDPESKAQARPHAKALGEAFQLTNFLRDVREDAVDFDRVYLPLETLRDHGVSEAQVRDLRFTPEFGWAMQELLDRTETRYRRGVAGIEYLPEDCRFAVLLAATLYADHHRDVRARGFDVLSERRTLTRRRRLWVLARTWYHYRRTGDPEAAFYAVAPVSEEPGASRPAAGGTTRHATGGTTVDRPTGCFLVAGSRSVCRVASELAGTVRALLPS